MPAVYNCVNGTNNSYKLKHYFHGESSVYMYLFVLTKGIFPLEYNKNHITWHEVLFS